MQIKTIMRYQYTPMRWPQSKTLTTPNVGKDVEYQELSFIADRNAKWHSHFGKQSGTFLQN